MMSAAKALPRPRGAASLSNDSSFMPSRIFSNIYRRTRSTEPAMLPQQDLSGVSILRLSKPRCPKVPLRPLQSNVRACQQVGGINQVSDHYREPCRVQAE
jgi:hypothetical protein